MKKNLKSQFSDIKYYNKSGSFDLVEYVPLSEVETVIETNKELSEADVQRVLSLFTEYVLSVDNSKTSLVDFVKQHFYDR